MYPNTHITFTSTHVNRAFSIIRSLFATSLLKSSNLSNTFKSIQKIIKPTILLLMMVSFIVPQARAQSSLSPERLSAVLTVVNMLLLSGRPEPIDPPEGTPIEIELNELLSSSFNVTESEPIYGQFDLQEEGVEFCFDLSASSPFSSSDVVVEVNGRAAQAVEGTDNCYQLSESQQRLINYISIRANNGVVLNVSRIELASTEQRFRELNKLTRGEWSERAVRKVLNVFAFGGHARTEQILLWADMDPEDAIQEMLNFQQHNLLLSPLAEGERYTDTATQHGTLEEYAAFLSNPNSDIAIPVTGTFGQDDYNSQRREFATDGNNFDDAFGRMITVRGLNPFRQRIGFWETNYHLAVNRDVGVSGPQVARYYDVIMAAHEAGLSYERVMGEAAKSAAIAEQYGHRRNQWIENNQECRCNDDFAREIHQLFYGIFGEDDPNHEDGTIRETAKMLTDMPILDDDSQDDDLVVNFGTNFHHIPDLTILGQTVSGANASEKIDSLMQISIEHPESLKNLPVMIISVLADDNMNEAKARQLRVSWASMGNDKNLLRFLQAYAISDLFHSNNQFKYFTTHERALYMANKNNLDNLEAWFGGGRQNGSRAGRSVGGTISDDNAGDFFRPLANVFGGQTSIEASDSALVFEQNYNTLTDDEQEMRDIVGCDDCDGTAEDPWEKKWNTVLPQREDGEFYVSDVAEWLWNHAVGNFDNYTELERAQLYTWLAAARSLPGNNSDQNTVFDFNLLMCLVEDYQRKESSEPDFDLSFANLMSNNVYNDYCINNDREDRDAGFDGYSPQEREAINRVYTGQDIADSPLIQSLLTEMGNTTLPLNAQGETNSSILRQRARERVNNALGFIFTTPFVFAEGE